ncbi:hypothetical protein AKJ61_02285 [candidate division MSBL1 archaeon SCGC-AAA259B11]|uniref:Uncharacterized protein n=1 Tax=candidate division MSBL1 archaeon SCGC-AAA259B11 TaxID=1698260 RepID=A0A133U6C5_9EURY|nr:hypothetical protein AKJ61_02285 [candidate division MSBL1 archaeon SCGC-AAA259B11]
MTKLEEGNRHWRKANGFHAIIWKKKETVELDIHRDPKRGKHKPGRASGIYRFNVFIRPYPYGVLREEGRRGSGRCISLENLEKRLLAGLVSAVGGLIVAVGGLIVAAGGITASRAGGFEGTVVGVVAATGGAVALAGGLVAVKGAKLAKEAHEGN